MGGGGRKSKYYKKSKFFWFCLVSVEQNTRVWLEGLIYTENDHNQDKKMTLNLLRSGGLEKLSPKTKELPCEFLNLGERIYNRFLGSGVALNTYQTVTAILYVITK